MAPDQELRPWEESIDPVPGPVDNILSEVYVCWGSLVEAGVGSGYLVGIGVS